MEPGERHEYWQEASHDTLALYCSMTMVSSRAKTLQLAIPSVALRAERRKDDKVKLSVQRPLASRSQYLPWRFVAS
jgi:hypothetical protein